MLLTFVVSCHLHTQKGKQHSEWFSRKCSLLCYLCPNMDMFCMTTLVTLANVQEFSSDLQGSVFNFDQIWQCRNFQSFRVIAYKSWADIENSSQFWKVTSPTKQQNNLQNVWRGRSCSGRWQWLRHVQGWIRRRWCPQGCLPIHCWPPKAPGIDQRNHSSLL